MVTEIDGGKLMATTKRWFITGCSSGFGRALAELALDRGDRVAVTARDPQSIADIVARAPDRAVGLKLDVTDPAQVRAARDAAWAAFGGIDVLVNNAGYGLQSAVEDATDDQIRHVFEVNVFGVIDTIRAFLPRLRDQGSGHIISVTSIGGRTSGALVGLYSATKFAIEGLSVGLTGDLAGHGIKVTVVEPGAFATDFATRSLVDAGASPAYAEVARQVGEWLAHATYEDPRGAARAIAALADLEEPPAQLLLGRAAADIMEGVLEAQLAELRRFKALSYSASEPG